MPKLELRLADIHDRLAGVVIEQLGYADVIAQHDSPETPFYLDPPYCDCEDDYGEDAFARADSERLAEQLEGIKASSCCRSTPPTARGARSRGSIRRRSM